MCGNHPHSVFVCFTHLIICEGKERWKEGRRDKEERELERKGMMQEDIN